MKQKNLILFLVLWANFSFNSCFGMEAINPEQLFRLAQHNLWTRLHHELTYYNSDINATNADGNTLLHLAVLAGETECVKALINKGANVTINSTKGKALEHPRNKSWQNRIDTPLHCAAQTGNIELIKLLLDAGADINSTYNNFGNTPLHLATWFGHPECVEFFIKKNAAINKQNLRGSTPVHLAAWREKPQCLNILVRAGATFEDKNSTGTGNTPLYLAAKIGSLECLRILIKHSPDKNSIINLKCSEDNSTPVQATISRQWIQCFWDLVINGANINEQYRDRDGTLKNIAELTDNNESLKRFIQLALISKTPLYSGTNKTCYLCKKAYANNDVIIELTSCKDSFHVHCLENYAIKDFVEQRIHNPLYKDNPNFKNKSKDEAEFNIRFQELTNLNEIKHCPQCNKPTDINTSTELTVFPA